VHPATALLVFPLRPGDATRALEGRAGRAAVLPVAVALLAGAFFRMRGAAWADAGAVAGAVTALSLALAAGGLLGVWPARLLLARGFTWRDHAGGCLAAGAWTGPLFVGILALATAAGAGPTAPLAAGFAVLVWGVVAGIGIVGGQDHDDQGRALVASCVGFAASLGALLGVLVLVQGHLLLVWPAAVDEPPVAAGDVMLVRPTVDPPAGSLVLVRNNQGTTVLARRGSEEGIAVPDPGSRGARGPWRPVGRVFFAFGGWGGRPVE